MAASGGSPRGEIQWPDLGTPPLGWGYARQGVAIHLVPPGAVVGHARATIVVAPMVPVSAQMPPPDVVIDQALNAERARQGLVVAEDTGAVAVSSASGLRGVRREVVVVHPGGARQRRAYVMYRDGTWLYGVTYLADEATWATFLPTFDAAASTVARPADP